MKEEIAIGTQKAIIAKHGATMRALGIPIMLQEQHAALVVEGHDGGCTNRNLDYIYI